ncbi:TonB-dependent Receptor Plug Domain [Mucilaginibacter mallensis]|uniref:TonB-dependent Receptor Plug Domain n=1 Tax=Mucilaginibacter mallensis TaxID=652787 RepID=A0A1H1TW21_MUCMA|nr:TonB-dependent receptor [Mucilaginibacter mallensis]SDS64364.1 TonB-dependent Receptor Plug Domain [Mucilaginibacter mallensis]
MRKYLLSLFISVFTMCLAYAQVATAQVHITGKLLDAQTKEPLIGATVLVKGTTKATSAALDGSFKLSVSSLSGTTLVISYVGYVSKEIEVTDANIGTVLVNPNSASMKEVVVNANPSLKINRQTPVAASSVGQIYIDEHGAGAEFPELMKMTPGVTVSRSGGGYGDSRINIRGFSSNNVALLINGIPVNDVEAGKIYWNDWAGLQDVTTSMQVQRGLGASTIAVPSMGGTIDISTRSTDIKEGGTISQSIGSYGAQKTLISYATGLSPDGWAASFLLSRATGNSPTAEGEYYTGYNYFANISKIIGKNQTLSINYMGASQRHGQLYTYNYVSTFQNAPQGSRYNSDWGYYNGQQYSAEQNYYNKPLASINYNWNINKTTSWSTILYGTWGTGAADYLAGTYGSLLPGSSNEVPRTGGTYSPIDFNAIEDKNIAANTANGNGAATAYMQDVVNNHQQYGAISTIKKTVGDITYLAGVDLRDYTGEHFQKVDNLFGSTYVQDTYTGSKGNINNPNNQATFGQKFNNDYTYDVVSEGAYAQAEYSKNDLTAFLTLSGSNTSNRRIDYFNYTPGNQDSKWINFLGYQAKGGANYNLDAHNNIYANIGYIQRAPLVGSLFLNKNNSINTGAVPEKLFDYELGYGYTSAQFTANVNAYRTSYRDRSQVFSAPNTVDPASPYYINVSGLNEMHEGIEADAKYRPIQGVVLGGMLSIGDYYYTSNTGAAQVTSADGKTTTQPALLVKGLKIGDTGSGVTGGPSAGSAQTTAGGTLDVKVLSHVTLGAQYLYYSHYYAAYNPSKISAANGFSQGEFQPYDIPNVGTMDLDVVFRFKMAGFDAEFIGNVYNVLNTKYISDAYESSPAPGLTPLQRIAGSPGTSTGTQPVPPTIGVNYGAPRFYMTTLKIKF